MGTGTSTVCRVLSVSKRYGHRPDSVFTGVDLDLQRGECVVIVGPSGCGKSTLLRLVAGLDHPSAGVVEFEGSSATGVGLVFQEPVLLPWLTVRENVSLAQRFRAVPDEPGLVGDLLARFGLTAVADARPAEISAGQAQRAALARALVARPQMLLLDEPFGALDPASRALMQELLLDEQKRSALTLLIVTHDMDEAIRLGDRVALMAPRRGIVRWWKRDEPSWDELCAAHERREMAQLFESDVTRAGVGGAA